MDNFEWKDDNKKKFFVSSCYNSLDVDKTHENIDEEQEEAF